MMKTFKDVLTERKLLPKLERMKWTDDIIAAMQEYAAEACKEQREICAEEYLRDDTFDADIILNAPQPQLL